MQLCCPLICEPAAGRITVWPTNEPQVSYSIQPREVSHYPACLVSSGLFTRLNTSLPSNSGIFLPLLKPRDDALSSVRCRRVRHDASIFPSSLCSCLLPLKSSDDFATRTSRVVDEKTLCAPEYISNPCNCLILVGPPRTAGTFLTCWSWFCKPSHRAGLLISQPPTLRRKSPNVPHT